MAFHEQHERNCPTCGERISATAPKCFNCGEFVDDEEDDDDDDDEEQRGEPRSIRGLVLGLVGALICVGLVVYFVRSRRPAPEADATAVADKLFQMMGQQAGHSSLNSSSPMAWAEVEPHLRVGMPFRELEQLISRKNSGPLKSTRIGTVPLPGDGQEADAAKSPRQARIIYLQDANLVVRTDEKENVVSWKREPIK